MVRKLMTAALILTLGLALTACGNETAGTAAQPAGLAPTPLPRSGPSSGRATPEVPWRTGATGLTTRTRPAVVDGYHTDSADGTRGSAKEDMKDRRGRTWATPPKTRPKGRATR